MSFKNFSTAQNSPAAPNTADKPKNAPDQATPATQPETPAAVAEPAPKS